MKKKEIFFRLVKVCHQFQVQETIMLILQKHKGQIFHIRK